MRNHRIVVVGAGIGGLAAAVDLSARGFDVCVLERGPAPGGKLREVIAGGQPVDAGPTVFTMRWVFDELFATAGARLADHLTLDPLRVLARHAWTADTRMDLFADVGASADAIGALAGAAEARRFRAFCLRARDIYATLERPFLRAPRGGPLALVRRAGLRNLRALMGIAPFRTLWSALADHFHDPRLRQLFGRYATYCGASPFAAPATLMLIAHVEQDGVWSIRGGMHRLARALASVAEAQGARLRTGADVREIVVAGGRPAGVVLASGERIDADACIVNADVAALAAGRFGTGAVAAIRVPAQAERSLSAVTYALHARTRGFPLVRHNVFFAPDCAAEFSALFRRGEMPADPTVYVCAQDRLDDGDARADGAQRLLCLVNAPASGDRRAFTATEVEQCEERTFSRLAACGLTVERTAADMVVTTPAEFERLFPATGGALYGLATHGWRASFQRPGSRSLLPGLYLAGGSTHPGPGVPMAALSGRLAASAIVEDLGSTRR
jgi:1-hydroxycarotenoid 3,4-desaturase